MSTQFFSEKIKKTKQQHGFLSLEMGLVLLVIAVIIVGSVMYYRDNLRKTSVQNNTQQILSAASNMRAKYGQSNQYGVVTTAIAVRSGVIPAALRDGDDATATNSFGGSIAVAPATLTGANDSVEITWPSVPKNQCSDIVTNADPEMRQIAVGSTTVKTNNGTLDLDALETACESDTTVDLHFWVGRS